ncbi:MAG: T9SS type A sorting domain-containing protein [Candidatus Marinimicrobia bacterium]|nr:T9SS type A sorting domain-containing protein [Candidatus Neomarinimicrobiota bacterium]
MKNSILISTFLCSILSATSYTTITVNGTNSGWASDETFTDISDADNAYVTWDATNIYVGIRDAEIDYNDQACFLYFDTDPTGSNGTTDAYAWGNNITAPFSADYILVFKFNSTEGSAYIEFRDYDDSGSSWSQTGQTTSYTYNTDNAQMAGGTDYLEFKIKRSILGVTSTTDKIRFCMFTEQQWDSNYRYFVFPGSSNIGNRASSQSIADYKSFTLGDEFSPDLSKVSIAGNSGFRMMSSPVAGQIYSDLLAELWTQGMTGADVTDGTANVWTLNVSGQSWTALTDISGSGGGASLTAGTGFLVYVFDDTDWDGDSDLPVSLSVSGSENSSSASLGSIANGEYGLAGNPYATTIDWDDISPTNLSGTVNVWDDAASGWKSWNGSSGSLTNGLIAPYQGFWVEASGGTGSITIETADKSTSSGAFYRTLDNDSTGSVSFSVVAADYTDQTFMSFMNVGEAGLDNADGKKLLPFSASSRVVGLSYTEEIALDIHNLPYTYEGMLSFPLDVMLLTLDETNYVTDAGEVNLSWNLDQLPDHISMTLTDNITGSETYLDLESEYVFTTEPKGSFSANYDGPIGTYPVVGEPRFTLSVTYGALGQNGDATLPSDFALHPSYPNPFNPSATISFDIPDVSLVALNIYDVKGALVETLLQNHMKPGKHHYNWEPQGLSSGVYFMKLTTAKQTFTQKVTYIK